MFRQVPEFSLSWRSISLIVEEKEGSLLRGTRKTVRKEILHNISGEVRPGQILAILGPSGAGKSSLLNVLSRNIKDGISGSLLLNGKPYPHEFKQLAAYVRQDSLFFSHLTVREVINYAAELRLPPNTSKAERKRAVDAVIEQLDLGKCADTIVGNEQVRGISGGELRRLAIATEIIHGPPIIFLDEPTSGLDAASALMVVRVLRKLANEGRTVICTIHQPRASILQQFDNMLLLAEGRMVFFGPFLSAVEFFESQGFPCPRFENPADFFMDLINTKDEAVAVDTPLLPGNAAASTATEVATSAKAMSTTRRKEIVDKLTAAFAEYRQHQQQLLRGSSASVPTASAIDSAALRRARLPWHRQLWVLLRRGFWYKLREPNAVMTQASVSIGLSLLLGGIYYNIGDDQVALGDRFAALSFVVLMLAFLPYDVVLLFAIERAIFTRENQAGLYTTSAFYLGRSLAEVPFHSLFAFIEAVVPYWMCGFRSSAKRFLVWVGITQLTAHTCTGLLMAVGSVAPDTPTANLLATIAIALLMLFNGFFVAAENIPVVFRWLRDINPLYYAVGATAKNEFDGRTFSCSETQRRADGQCVIATGEDALESFGFPTIDIGQYVLIIAVLLVVLRAIAYLGLRFLHRGRRWRLPRCCSRTSAVPVEHELEGVSTTQV